MNKDSRFWDRIAGKYYRSPIKDPAAYEEKLTITRRYLKPDSHVLEFGCGTGGTAIKHAPYVERIHAIDVSQQMLQFAQSRAKELNVSNVEFQKSSIETYSNSPASYDVILGLSILHLVEDKDAVINKVFHLLKPGGVFISSTACMEDNLKILKYVMPIGRALGALPTVKVFKQQELVDTIENHGFTTLQQWRPELNMAAFIVAVKNQSQLAAPERDNNTFSVTSPSFGAV